MHAPVTPFALSLVQFILLSDDVTVFEPLVENIFIERTGSTMNVAVTSCADDIVTVHVDEFPLQPPPDQLLKIIFGSATAVRTTVGVEA